MAFYLTVRKNDHNDLSGVSVCLSVTVIKMRFEMCSAIYIHMIVARQPTNIPTKMQKPSVNFRPSWPKAGYGSVMMMVMVVQQLDGPRSALHRINAVSQLEPNCNCRQVTSSSGNALIIQCGQHNFKLLEFTIHFKL